MGDIYNDKMRHDNFQGRQDDIENNIQSTADNYSNELLQSKLADVQNKTIGSELMFSSIPASIGKATETYSRVKDVYQKLQDVKSKASDLVDSVKGQTSDLVDSVKGQASGLVDSLKTQVGISSDVGDIGKDSKVFVNPLFDEGAEIKPVAETFGNVKNYLGGQVGDLGDKVSVLPNAETSIGSLKQAIPKPSIIEDGIADTTKTVTDVAKSAVSDATDVASTAISGATDLAAEGTSILAEAAIPVVGDIAAVGSLIYGAFEGIKDLVDKPTPAPVPTVNVQAGGVNQAGI